MNSVQVQPFETSYVMTSAFHMCRKKATRKNYAGDKLGGEEKATFQNCITKYISMTEHSYEGLRGGFLESYQD